MKRLIRVSDDVVDYQIGNRVQWKKHPYDTSIYEVKEILPDGTLFIDNGQQSYTNIKPSVVEPAI